MRSIHRLSLALLVSLSLHGLLLFGAYRLAGDTASHLQRAHPPLQARLQPPRAVPPADQLYLPAARRAPQRATPPDTGKPATGQHGMRIVRSPARDGRQHAVREVQQQLAQRLLYPPEAVAQGLEGEVQVLIVLDAQGAVLGARIERSSGSALLDEAALRAAREVRGVAAAASQEMLLPVRFKLR